MKHGFDVAHHRFEVLAFVKEHAIPVGYLVFPVLLPFAQRVFFKETVGTDNQHRSGSLEPYTSFDTDNRIAYVHVAPDSVRGTDLFYFLDGFDFVIEHFTVDGTEFSILEFKA